MCPNCEVCDLVVLNTYQSPGLCCITECARHVVQIVYRVMHLGSLNARQVPHLSY